MVGTHSERTAKDKGGQIKATQKERERGRESGGVHPVLVTHLCVFGQLLGLLRWQINACLIVLIGIDQWRQIDSKIARELRITLVRAFNLLLAGIGCLILY